MQFYPKSSITSVQAVLPTNTMYNAFPLVLTDREVEIQEQHDVCDQQWCVLHDVVDIPVVVVYHRQVCWDVGGVSRGGERVQRVQVVTETLYEPGEKQRRYSPF